jgi:hypothetical protein
MMAPNVQDQNFKIYHFIMTNDASHHLILSKINMLVIVHFVNTFMDKV